METVTIEVPPLDNDAIRKIAQSNDETVLAIADGNPGAASVLAKAQSWFAEHPESVKTFGQFLQKCLAFEWIGPRLWYHYKYICSSKVEDLIIDPA